MKKIISILIVAVIVFGFCGCGEKKVDERLAEYGQTCVTLAEDALNGTISLDDASKKIDLQATYAENRYETLKESDPNTSVENAVLYYDIGQLNVSFSLYAITGGHKDDVLKDLKDLKKQIKK